MLEDDDVLSMVLYVDVWISVFIVILFFLRINIYIYDVVSIDLVNIIVKIQFFFWIGVSFGFVVLWVVYVGI